MSASETVADYRQLAALVRPFLPRLGFALMVMVLGSLIQLASPWLAGQFSDALLIGRSLLPMSTGAILLLIGVLFTVNSVLRFGAAYVIGTTGEILTATLRQGVYAHLMSLPVMYHREEKRGEVMSFITNDVEVISQFVTGTLVSVIPMLITLLGAFLIVLNIAPEIVLIALFLVPVFLLMVRFLRRGIQPLSKQLMDSYSASYGTAYDHLLALPLIKSYAQEERVSHEYRTSNQKIVDITKKLTLLQALISPLVQTTVVIGILIVLWYGSELYLMADGTPGQIVSLVLYGLLVARPASQMAGLIGEFIMVHGASGRLRNLLAVSPESDTGTAEVTEVNSDIVFSDIHFAYDDRKPVFAGFDLVLPAGQIVAITGANGIGKTTLTYLLTRFVTPQSGHVLIDGTDTTDIKLSSLRHLVAMVHQESYVMNRSVRENICFACPDASDEMMRQAARIAQAHDFIDRLPNQFDTIVGDEGGLISGGQQQRIVLARAILSDRPVLVLDEATSWFDMAAERAFVAALRPALQGKTVIIITHRQAMLELADQVVDLSPEVVLRE